MIFLWDEDDWEPSEEELAEIKRAEQDMIDGFTYELVGRREMKCNKCGRIGEFMEKPFPHRFDCPMKPRYDQE